MDKFLTKIVEVLENNRRSYDIFINVRKKEIDIMGVYGIARDLLKRYEETVTLMGKHKEFNKKKKKDNFEIKIYLKTYLNFIMKMPECHNDMSGKQDQLNKIKIIDKN